MENTRAALTFGKLVLLRTHAAITSLQHVQTQQPLLHLRKVTPCKWAKQQNANTETSFHLFSSLFVFRNHQHARAAMKKRKCHL